MINRYSNRTIYRNSQKLYEEFFEERNVKFINQYNTAVHTYPDNYNSIQIYEHIWSTGDRFYKLATEYYGDPRDWWIIAKFNNKPTESHLKLGDIVYIPTPLYEVMRVIK